MANATTRIRVHTDGSAQAAVNQLKFDLYEAIVLRDRGIKLVAQNNPHFLTVARNVARQIAMRQGEVTSDDVRRECPIDPLHHNAWGGIWKGKEWEWTGEYRTSHIVSRHGGEQKVWRLR